MSYIVKQPVAKSAFSQLIAPQLGATTAATAGVLGLGIVGLILALAYPVLLGYVAWKVRKL